jgi:predicted transcriptional regulator
MPDSSLTHNVANQLHERVQALLAIGLTQLMIAEEMGCSQPHVSALAKTPDASAPKKPRPSANVVDGLRRLEVKYAQALALAA